MITQTLTVNDLNHVVRRLPKDVRELMTKYQNSLFLGGGFIRAVVAGEEPSDIDLFGVSKEMLNTIAKELQATRGGEKWCRLHHSKNAITVICMGRISVQFITRWTFPTAAEVCASFDFTVCQAAIYRDGAQKNDPWRSVVADGFYIDLAARRLVYTHPVRDEEAGGSLLRAMKYQKRGYVMQMGSLAGVIARLVRAVDSNKVAMKDEDKVRFVLTGLLQEVDPSIAVDGLEVIHDHEQPDDTTSMLADDLMPKGGL